MGVRKKNLNFTETNTILNCVSIEAVNTNGTLGERTNSINVGHGKTMTTDTEEDETVDFLLKSAMTVPKGQPPKKRTKKYGERKSCKLNKIQPNIS